MMSKTHVAMGTATALLVLQPHDVPSCLIALSGGALGGVVADIDVVKNDYKHDALIGQVVAVSALIISLIIDYFANYGICTSIISQNKIRIIIGIVMYLALLIFGFASEHRTFTHSLLALILFSASIYMIIPQVVLAYVIGYTIHLILDLLNKKPVPLLFPKEEGICLKLFYAKGVANVCFLLIGVAGTVFLILNALTLHIW